MASQWTPIFRLVSWLHWCKMIRDSILDGATGFKTKDRIWISTGHVVAMEVMRATWDHPVMGYLQLKILQTVKRQIAPTKKWLGMSWFVLDILRHLQRSWKIHIQDPILINTAIRDCSINISFKLELFNGNVIVKFLFFLLNFWWVHWKLFIRKIKFLAKYCVLIEQSLRTIPQTISIWNIESGPRIILIILHLQHMICDLIIISVSELVKTVAIKQVKIFLLQTRIWSHLLPLWHPSIFPVIIENKSSDSPVNQYLTGYVLCYEYILSTPSTICHMQVLHYDTNIFWILIWIW